MAWPVHGRSKPMKTYVLSFAQALTHVPEHPERTAKRSGNGFDVHFQVWPNAAAMLKSIEMQGRRAPRATDWRPVR
jgi:hypothetical protein